LLNLLLIRERDVFNQQLFEDSIDKLNQSGRFQWIDRDRDTDFKTDEERGFVEIVIKLNNATSKAGDQTLKRRPPEPKM